jgi:Phage derived protein Gp49-like (DUF891)
MPAGRNPYGTPLTVEQILAWADANKARTGRWPTRWSGPVAESWGETWAIYTVQFAGVVYVLHAFQKKSKRGIKTPPEEIAKVKARLKEAEKHDAEWAEEEKQQDKGHPGGTHPR